jgi:hypothetical protein
MKGTSVTNSMLVLENDQDPDGDIITVASIRDTHNQISNPAFGGTVSIPANRFSINYAPRNGFLAPPVLNLEYTITDDDLDQPLTATSFVNVTIVNNGPRATDDYITTVFNTNAYIDISTLLANDISPTGQIGSGITWIGIEDCNTLGPAYCGGGYSVPIINPNNQNQVLVPYKTNSCKSVVWKYCIAYALDPSATQCGTVTVSYSNCQCIVPVDITFVLDSSGSITSANWRIMMDLVQNITNKLNLGQNYVQAGFVQYATDAKEIQPLTWKRTELNSKITWLRSNHMAKNTNTREGLVKGVATNDEPPRSLPGTPGAKVIMLLTDGISNTGGDPVPYAQTVNAWTVGASGNPTPTVAWKIVAAGIGDQLYYNNQAGWKQVQKLNYNPATTLAAKWETLDQLVSSVVDATCDV